MTGDEKNLSLFMVLVAAVILFGIFTIPSCVAVNTCLQAETKNPVLCELVLQNKYPITERMTDEKFAR